MGRTLCFAGAAALAGLVALGCEKPPAPVPQAASMPKPSAASATPADELLAPLLMAEKPANAISVTEALTRKEGETVIVRGQTPPENTKQLNAAVAAFLLMAPEDLAKPEVKDELSCDDAPT